MPKRKIVRPLSMFPDIATQWHPSKNGDLTPDKVEAGSNKKYWWRCPAGPDHEWVARVANRTNLSTSCPFCCGRRVSITNSLASLYPEVADQWHWNKNIGTVPEQVASGTGKKYWWKCSAGPDHEWEAQVSSRTKGGTACPYCSGLKTSDTNSLAHLYPEVASQWHPTRNGTLQQSDVAGASGKRSWWQCPSNPNHIWEAPIIHRTKMRTGCPFCSGKRIQTNSLAHLHPEVAAQWDTAKNGGVTPYQVFPGSKKQHWWRCPEGPDHSWLAAIATRTKNSSKCPFCVGRRLSVTNSLAALYPNVATEWHPSRNGSLTPENVLGGTSKYYWWQCSVGLDHEWEASVSSRTKGNKGCPFCRGLKVSRTNSLESLYPEIAALWHPTKNESLTPSDVVAGSGKEYWWHCTRNLSHEWTSSVALMTRAIPRCRFCGMRPRVPT